MADVVDINQKKSTGRGGRRPGAGRKPGAVTKKTREIAEKVAESGLTPLEVMIDAMLFLRDAGEREKAASIAKDAAPYVHARLSSVDVQANVTHQTLDQELAALNAVRDAKGDSPVA